MPLVDVHTAPFRAKPIEDDRNRAQKAAQARRGARSKKMESGHCIGYTQDPSSGQVHVIGSALTQMS
ncbi:MAG: hypothetical protein J5804_03720, partial [Eggerthellaceae bacterium]|nr:hypothetical protein [Eggerthellaceae bacterium]